MSHSPPKVNPPRHVTTNNPGSSPTNVSSLSSGRSNVTNHTNGASKNRISGSDRNQTGDDNNPRRRSNDSPSPNQSRKKPRYRPNQAKKKNKHKKERRNLERQFRSNMEQSMRNDPSVYRVYNLTEIHCRDYVKKDDNGNSIYCGLIECNLDHEHALRNKIAKVNPGKIFVCLCDITSNGVPQIMLWNKITRRHYVETESKLLSVGPSYQTGSGVLQSKTNQNQKDVWSLGSSGSKSNTEGKNNSPNTTSWGSNESKKWSYVRKDNWGCLPRVDNEEFQDSGTVESVSMTNNEASDNVTEFNQDDNRTRLASNCSTYPPRKEIEVKERTAHSQIQLHPPVIIKDVMMH